ncbi:hypothetical protein QOY93_05145 [Leclercia adecarboxylata]|uniref:hypothetical protein n=1 Tax=Leclercia adecarboxylata TaxID=83655 RepID=UPI002550349C|nr:hypothetical protein [Leclercia adecarboxylata]MDK4744759.1 hypothetical protein [Leclercia adecarboxylata]
MEKMIAAQKSLEIALLILIENDDNEEKQRRIYQECLCTITQESLPHLLRMDYFSLLRLANVPFNSAGKMSPAGPDTSQGINALLPMAILLLYKRLTEWLSVEAYLRKRHVSAR